MCPPVLHVVADPPRRERSFGLRLGERVYPPFPCHIHTDDLSDVPILEPAQWQILLQEEGSLHGYLSKSPLPEKRERGWGEGILLLKPEGPPEGPSL